MKRTIVIAAIALSGIALYLIGCGVDTPVDTEKGAASAQRAPILGSTELSTVLVPNGDVPQWGWVPYPAPPWTRYDKIDEGTSNPDLEFIYTIWNNREDRFTFTDISGYDDVDVSEIVFSIKMNVGLIYITLMAGLDFWYYIDGEEQGTARLEYWGEEGTGVDTTWVITFGDVCYDLDEVNSLEITIKSIGVWWDPDCAAIDITAIDADVKYDERCTPEIYLLGSNRNNNTVTVSWETECPSTSTVIWGYDELSLTNTATAASGSEHSVSFDVGSTEGCVYYRAISEGLTCSAPADTSDTGTDVKAVVISNVVRTFDPIGCEFVVTWTTNVKSSSKVYYGSSCQQLNGVQTGANDTTSHSVRIDASGYPLKYKLWTKPESASACDAEQGSCGSATRQYCVSG